MIIQPVYLAKKYTENNVSELISKLNFIFSLQNKTVKGFRMDVTTVSKDFTALSALIIYKFITFSVENNCFDVPKTNKALINLFAKFELHSLVEGYYNKSEKLDKLYADLKPKISPNFFIAPHPVSRTVIKNSSDLEKKYYESIRTYYSNLSTDTMECIKTCLVEIASNFYSHAIDPTSILMAEGTPNSVEIVSVDTSSGIIETMKEAYQDKTDKDILNHAFCQRVSSKFHEGHCGTGLWLINEIVTLFKGKLILHTGGYLYRNIQGKITTFETSYWKGTILYIKLPLLNNVSIDLNSIVSSNNQYIK